MPAALLIRDVTVVDTLSGALSPAVDVLVRETRITSITPGGTAVPRDAEVVEVDVANLRRIDSVILGGLHLDAARLQRVRAEVEATGLRWGRAASRVTTGSRVVTMSVLATHRTRGGR